MEQMFERYYRLTRVSAMGPETPRCFQKSTVLVVGCGALGSATASLLVRLGIGQVRLVDRDVVDEANLADQCLYTEQDAAEHRPKAEVAAGRLAAFNQHVRVDGRVADFLHDNAEKLVEGVDLIIDGSDNLETKYLLNDVAVATHTPWIYAGCAGIKGVVLAVLPGRTHCLRCIWPEPPPRVDGCESMGVLSTTVSMVASVQVTEALKILLGRTDELVGGLMSVDAWTARFRKIPIPEFQPGNCPTCGDRDFPYLAGQFASRTIVMCGRKAIMVIPGRSEESNYVGMRDRLARRFSISEGLGYLSFEADGYHFLIFPSGRALIVGASDPLEARALYGRYFLP